MPTLRQLTIAAAVLPSLAAAAPPANVDQGADWGETYRLKFYKQDQGSQLIPLGWLRALKHPDGTGFLSDALSRYGYLPNPDSGMTNRLSPLGLPVGFTASGPDRTAAVGMTCSACHTRELQINGVSYRIDGGPAIVDFYGLLSDIDAAVGLVLSSQSNFDSFAGDVLPQGAQQSDRDLLRQDLQAWASVFHAIVSNALPGGAGWGLGRLDAVGMIFDRLVGLDLGKPPSYVIANNMRKTDAPVRYPFLWNAPRQDRTDWPGFAGNGNDLLALARNLGEEYGVFGVMHPKPDIWALGGIDYLHQNSANFDGIGQLENLVKRIGRPKWPFPLADVSAGKEVFWRAAAGGSCASCHEPKPSGIFGETWTTQVQAVGTDSREWQVMAWTVKDPGALSGALDFSNFGSIKAGTPIFDVLTTAVVASILQHAPQAIGFTALPDGNRSRFVLSSTQFGGLRNAFAFDTLAKTDAQTGKPTVKYESRVLAGIWAAAPYLHNGSVPTLADLLKKPCSDTETPANPDSCRPVAFKVGRVFDVDKVGVAAAQSGLSETRVTTDCSDVNSGNSRCGHAYGVDLPTADKKALLEYLKSL